MALTNRPTKAQIIEYIEATLTQGLSKGRAYKKCINPDIKNGTVAAQRLEKTPEYQALMETLTLDDELKMNKQVAKVRSKYVNLIENNIDAMNDIIAQTKGGEINDRAKAVRLANETITAMQIVDGPRDAGSGGNQPKLNRGGAVL